MLFIPGHNLSSECGDQYFQCQQLLTETVPLQDGANSGMLDIVFVPLEKGILLLNYWYDSDTLALTMGWNIYIVPAVVQQHSLKSLMKFLWFVSAHIIINKSLYTRYN